MRLVVESLSYAHPGQSALLTGIDFQAQIGESVAIVGPSGSGKTTLLALLGGLLKPTAGRIEVFTDTGRDTVTGNVCWVLQTVNVLSDRSVIDNVSVGTFADGLSPRQARSRSIAALDAVGLSGVEDRPVRTLSGGEAQRVVIARAAVSGRPVLLADEPTGQLDGETSTHVIEALLTSSSNKIAIVVTHDLAVARRCNRILALSSGQLRESAP